MFCVEYALRTYLRAEWGPFVYDTTFMQQLKQCIWLFQNLHTSHPVRNQGQNQCHKVRTLLSYVDKKLLCNGCTAFKGCTRACYLQNIYQEQMERGNNLTTKLLTQVLNQKYHKCWPSDLKSIWNNQLNTFCFGGLNIVRTLQYCPISSTIFYTLCSTDYRGQGWTILSLIKIKSILKTDIIQCLWSQMYFSRHPANSNLIWNNLQNVFCLDLRWVTWAQK